MDKVLKKNIITKAAIIFVAVVLLVGIGYISLMSGSNLSAAAGPVGAGEATMNIQSNGNYTASVDFVGVPGYRPKAIVVYKTTGNWVRSGKSLLSGTSSGNLITDVKLPQGETTYTIGVEFTSLEDDDPGFPAISRGIVTVGTFTTPIYYPLPETPIKEGHTFVGWYYDAELTMPFVSGTIITESIELYARFDINRYNVRYFAFGEVIEDEMKDWGREIELIPELDEAAKEDIEAVTGININSYVYGGMYLDENFTIPFTGGTLSSNLDIYLKFTFVEYKITFMVDSVVYVELFVTRNSALVFVED